MLKIFALGLRYFKGKLEVSQIVAYLFITTQSAGTQPVFFYQFVWINEGKELEFSDEGVNSYLAHLMYSKCECWPWTFSFTVATLSSTHTIPSWYKWKWKSEQQNRWVDKCCNILLQVVDGLVIIISFTLDLYFIDGVSPGGEGVNNGATILVILLLWRILRVFNGKIPTFHFSK